MQKGSAWVLIPIIGVLVIVSFGVYYYTNQPKIPPGEKTFPLSKVENNFEIYSNSQLGFEFKYLTKGLQVKEDSEEEFNKRGNGDFRKNFRGYVGYEPGKFLGAVSVLEGSINFDTNPFTIWVFENPQALSIDAWYKNYWYYPFVWGDYTYKGKFTLAPKDEATISGQLAKSGIIDYQPGKPKFIYLAKNERMYLVRIIEESAKEAEQILTSFRLLD